jgi:hypothetical protein
MQRTRHIRLIDEAAAGVDPAELNLAALSP